MAKKPEKRSWTVSLKASVDKELITDECTAEEAENDPYSHAVSEHETGCNDWEVTDVRPNS